MENSKLTAFRLKTYDSGTGWVIRDTATNRRIAADLKQEYAERIVRAVNAHDELVAACKRSVDFIQNFGSHRHLHGHPAECSHCILIADLSKAVAKATGGAE